MEIIENRLRFVFPDNVHCRKYDDTDFYRQLYEKMSEAKGVDIVASSSDCCYIIEVKDCSDTAENQDKWRRAYSGERNMDSLAQEIALKVAHTCAAIYGVSTYGERNKNATDLLDVANGMSGKQIADLSKKLLVLLYLEGDFSTETRKNTMIRRDIRQRIERRLKWLNCKVDVVSTEFHAAKDFSVELM